MYISPQPTQVGLACGQCPGSRLRSQPQTVVRLLLLPSRLHVRFIRSNGAFTGQKGVMCREVHLLDPFGTEVD